jgi:hypothetical protein
LASPDGLSSMELVKFVGVSMESGTPICLLKKVFVFQFNRMIRSVFNVRFS